MGSSLRQSKKIEKLRNCKISASKYPEDYSEYSINIRRDDGEIIQNIIPGVTCIELPPCPKESDNSIGIVPRDGQVLSPGKSCKRIKQPSIQLEMTKSPNLMSKTEAKMLTTAKPEILPPCPDSDG